MFSVQTMKRCSIFIVSFSLFIGTVIFTGFAKSPHNSLTTSVSDVETFILDVIEDSENGFHTIIEKYKTQNAPVNGIKELSEISGYGSDSKEYYISFTIANDAINVYQSALKAKLSDWEVTDKLGPGPYPYIRYDKKLEGEDQLTVTLFMSGEFSVRRLCSACKNPVASQSVLMNRLFHEEGKRDFQRLLKSAENGFSDLIVPDSKQGNTYSAKTSYLNPQIDNAEQFSVKEQDGERILTIQPKKEFGTEYFAFELLEHPTYNYIQFVPKENWEYGGTEASFTATKQTADGQYVRVRRRIDPETNNDFLEIVSSNTQPLSTEEIELNDEKDQLKAYLGCRSGNCENGFGVYNYLEEEDHITVIGVTKMVMTYEGQFQNGQFHGLGRLSYFGSSKQLIEGTTPERISLGEKLPDVVGRFVNGQLDESSPHLYPRKSVKSKFGLIREVYKSNSITYTDFEMFSDENSALDVYTLPVAKQVNGSVRIEHEYIVYDRLPSGKELNIAVPVSTAFGSCISGGCGTGVTTDSGTEHGSLRIDGLGVFTGQFHRDGSASRGILTLESGDGIGIHLYKGIPVRLENVIVPRSSSRLEKAKAGWWLLTLRNMCLQGDCTTNGQGVSSYVYNCEGRPKPKQTVGYYTGKHSDWLVPESGSGTYHTYFLPYRYDDPNFFCHELDGMLTLTHTNNEDYSEDILFKKDIKYTKDGSEPYEDFLARERNAKRKAWLDSLENERLKQVAANEARRAEQRRKIEQQRKSRIASQAAYKSKSCRTCSGSGFYWQDTSTLDCTVTYDYTYSHGKHYKTYEHCEENESGNYVVCGACGGKGRFD